MASVSEWTTCLRMDFSTDWWAKFRLLISASWFLQGQDTLALSCKHCIGHTLLPAPTTPLPFLQKLLPELVSGNMSFSLLKFKLEPSSLCPAGERGHPSPSPTPFSQGMTCHFYSRTPAYSFVNHCRKGSRLPLGLREQHSNSLYLMQSYWQGSQMYKEQGK